MNELQLRQLKILTDCAQVFTTGTMGELTPVVNIDGRVIGSGVRGPVTTQLQDIYRTLPEREGWATPIPEYE